MFLMLALKKGEITKKKKLNTDKSIFRVVYFTNDILLNNYSIKVENLVLPKTV